MDTSSAKEFNIVSLPIGDNGSDWYRIRELFKEIDKQDLAKTTIIEPGMPGEEMMSIVESADIIVARSGMGQMVKIIKQAFPEKPIVFESDDNTFEILPSNHAYLFYGVEDVVVDTDKGLHPLWVTGLTPGFNRYNNLWKKFETEFILEVCNLATSPVEHLSKLWGTYTQQTAIIPNYIDFTRIKTPDFKKSNSGEFRIGWQGGSSHLGDFERLGPRLTDIVNFNDGWKYLHIGVNDDFSNFLKIKKDRIETFDWVDFDEHLPRLQSLNLDVGIVAMEDKPFNAYKSEVKFSEYAALGIPALVPDLMPYVVGDEICVDNVNCLTYSSMKEFEEKLYKLQRSPKLRSRLAKRAYEWVQQNRDLKSGAKEFVELYRLTASKSARESLVAPFLENTQRKEQISVK